MEALVALIWVAVPCAFAAGMFNLWLDRIHPKHKPDPSGKELLDALEIHRLETNKALEALSGRITFKERQRLRE